jgi:thiamine biosynthesis lipoprotein
VCTPHRALALALAVTTASAACTRTPQRFQTAFVAMHASLEVTVLADDAQTANAAFEAARNEVERLESLLSDYRPASDVSRLNRRQAVELAPETLALLRRAQEVCHETDGAFDISLRPVKHLWGFVEGATPRVPAADSLDALLAHVGCDVYTLTSERGFEWQDARAQIDLGGIAQGFVAGCVADTLRARGITRFLINVSGDVFVGGERPGGGPWRVGIQHPRQPDSLLATTPMRWHAVTTSGDYEQYFVVDDVRHHHIFDPRSGRPARGVISVSVFAPDAVDADCYATALFVLGPERGLKFVEESPNLEGLFVVESATGVDVRASDGLLDLVR